MWQSTIALRAGRIRLAISTLSPQSRLIQKWKHVLLTLRKGSLSKKRAIVAGAVKSWLTVAIAYSIEEAAAMLGVIISAFTG